MIEPFYIYPVGIIRRREDTARIDIYPPYREGLLGLDQFSHIHVLYWLHINDTTEKRKTLKVHPRKNPANPLTGVFATHSPRRPNPLALSLCQVRAVDDDGIDIEDIDAFDGSPVIDIKAYFPRDADDLPIRYPAWE
jgi:tRNA-Thr(GGU) m(6)t(6)A37 methyltransferase TsaA